MKLPTLLYASALYQSHARSAADCRRVLSRWYPEIEVQSQHLTRFAHQRSTADSLDKDVVILHVEPLDYGELYERYEQLKRSYVIAVCVWEATAIPEPFRRSIAHVQEIWTCSKYSFDCFSNEHANVIYMPNIIDRDCAVPETDRREMRAIVNYDEECVYYLSITNRRDIRKNSKLLIEAFQHIATAMPRARLIVKGTGDEKGVILRDEAVTYIDKQLSDGQMNALYDLANVYVSPHHAEGWGLPMSDALLFKKPVVATGYSGNLEFMDHESGLLVDYQEEYIHPSDQYYLFDGGMKWAYPVRSDLEDKLIWCYQNTGSARMRALVENGETNARRFAPNAVEQRLVSRLEALCA